jgi:uncharacterized protein
MKPLLKTAVTAAGLAGAVLFWDWQGAAEGLAARRSFDIVTGSPAGSLFPAGEAIARVVSHPPGLPRCEKKDICGPPGVIVSVRSSDGAVANVLAVDAGSAASGLAQGPVAEAAVAGRGPFSKYGRQSHIRVIADLFPEAVQLVVATGSPIRKLGDLSGKRVSLGSAGSGGAVIAGEILSATGVRGIKLRHDAYETSAGLLQQGRLDAFFYLGETPSPLIGDLVARGVAHLMPIQGKLRSRLLARVPGLAAATIASDTYSGSGLVETVSCRTLWLAHDGTPPDIVYGLVRALFHPANQTLLAAQNIRLGRPDPFSVKLHPGAERFYREAGLLSPLRKR